MLRRSVEQKDKPPVSTFHVFLFFFKWKHKMDREHTKNNQEEQRTRKKKEKESDLELKFWKNWGHHTYYLAQKKAGEHEFKCMKAHYMYVVATVCFNTYLESARKGQM